MITLGIVLLLLGYLIPVPPIVGTIGAILIVVGVVLLLLGVVGHPVLGRRWY